MNPINYAQAVDTLNSIIKMQSGIIDGLFSRLSQHITAEELERLPEVDKINEAARLRHALRLEEPSDG